MVYPDPQFENAPRLSRRNCLYCCGISASGWALWSQLAGRLSASDAASHPSPVRSCIFVYWYGGPSHLDTFDPKPDAPAEIRGEFTPIATSAAGIQISEYLPQLSRVMHHVALVRSMHHSNRLHDSAGTETFTGRQGPQGDREEFAPTPQFFPCQGAVLHALRSNAQADVQHAILPWLFHNVVNVPCQGGGFLGSGFDPLLVTGDPQALTYDVPALQRPPELSLQRIAARRSLLSSVQPTPMPVAGRASQLEALYTEACRLLKSPTLEAALEIEHEDDATRRKYGLGQEPSGTGSRSSQAPGRNLRGQNLLMARRLVEAGVPFVNVNDYRQQGQNWDAHADNFRQHRQDLLPAADRGLAALIEDLEERGLLESTLVVALGEFGRTPKINGQAGRDHWPDCYTILLAGGGIRGGQVYGASDSQGAYPARDPVTPADLAATIYWRFGLDPHTEVQDHTGRPWRIADGVPLERLFA